MNMLDVNGLDARQLKSGHIRLRFKLSQQAYDSVLYAISLTGYKHSNAALDAISINCLSAYPFKTRLKYSAMGSQRFLVKLHPDQYEVVLDALKLAVQHTESYADALALMCIWFIKTETNTSLSFPH